MEMKLKKYWSQLPMLYGFGSIFDPWLKLEGLESGLEKLCVLLQIDCYDQYPLIKDKIFSLYSFYENRFRNTACGGEESQQRDENLHSFINVFELKKKNTQREVGGGSSSRGGATTGKI